MRLRRWLLGTCAALAMGQSPEADFIRVEAADPHPGPLAGALAQVEAQRLRETVAWLADPARQGRGLGTQGLKDAVHELEGRLKSLGLRPLGPAYRQAVPIRRVTPGGGSVALRAGSRTFRFQAGRDAVLPPVAPGALQGPLVFVGRGIQEPGLGHDDFKGLTVRGKVVAFLPGLPEGPAWQTAELKAKYDSPRPADRYDARLALLEKLGAKAALALEPGLAARIAAGQEPPAPYFLPARGVPGPGEPPLARLALTPALQASLGHPRDAHVRVVGRVDALSEPNLLARLEGSDPEAREAILLGAHLDHLGMPGGVTHPGADDNASGVAALLEIARILAAAPQRPRRPLLLALWTGEEEGKFGSGHYTRHPRWPLARTRAYLNLDMLAHPWTAAELRTLALEAKLPDADTFLKGLEPAWFAEPGVATGHRGLGAMLARAGQATGMSLHLDWTDGKGGGSDYRDFARRGVPFVRFFGNYFDGYHTPRDTPDRLDAEQLARMTRLVLATAWLAADDDAGR